jgi:hypothetical protein
VALPDLCGEESSFGGVDDLAGGLAPYGSVKMQGRGGVMASCLHLWLKVR